MKFGGTSVADADAIARLVRIVQRQCERDGNGEGPVVVVSALSRVTDRLLEIGRLAQAAEIERAIEVVEGLRERHLSVAGGLLRAGDALAALEDVIERECDTLASLVRALGVLREVSPRTLDALAAIGELLSSQMVTAALSEAGVHAVWIDARRAIVTDGDHGVAAPLLDETTPALQAEVAPALRADAVPVLGGFVGATREGVTTTLGRGGSDYSASIVGACLGAAEIQIWTDVDGMLTADPRVVDDPVLVPRLSFAEASELAYFGAKVLHPSTIQPAVARAIPVRILNARRPDATGTLITAAGGSAPDGPPVTALACKRDVTVVDITSTRMLMAHGFLSRVFGVFERFTTAVDVVTTSEVSVSVTVDDRRRLDALVEALSAFAQVSCEHEMALICVVGERLRNDPDVFAQVVGAVSGLTLRMVSQAASRRNITLVLGQADLPEAMRRLHDQFFARAERTADAADLRIQSRP